MKERISALLDGELAPSERAAVFEAIKLDDEARAEWQAYCLVGDALRGDCESGCDILSAVMAELENEPTVISSFASKPLEEARNDAWWSRSMPIAAAVMGIAVVAWAGLGLRPAELIPVADLASLSAKAPKRVQTVSAALSDAETNRAYLLAHHGYAGTQTMPGVGYYMRTVADASMEESAR